MPRVRFVSDYDYKPKPGVTIAYKTSWSGLVHRACAERAVALGKAEYVAVAGPPPSEAIVRSKRTRRGPADGQTASD